MSVAVYSYLCEGIGLGATPQDAVIVALPPIDTLPGPNTFP